MTDHSPEPWHVSGLDDDGEGHDCYYIQVDEVQADEFSAVAMTSEWCVVKDIEQAKANAERIVACVNFCAGMSTEDLVQKQLPPEGDLSIGTVFASGDGELLEVVERESFDCGPCYFRQRLNMPGYSCYSCQMPTSLTPCGGLKRKSGKSVLYAKLERTNDDEG